MSNRSCRWEQRPEQAAEDARQAGASEALQAYVWHVHAARCDIEMHASNIIERQAKLLHDDVDVDDIFMGLLRHEREMLRMSQKKLHWMRCAKDKEAVGQLLMQNVRLVRYFQDRNSPWLQHGATTNYI